MSRFFSKRLAKLEEALIPRPKRFPCVIHVRFGETHDDAFARVIAEFGPIPKSRTGFLIVPARPITDEEKLAVRERTEIRQAALMAFVRQGRREAQIVRI